MSGGGTWQFFIDRGGTFTDLVAFDESAGRVLQSKQLTTPHELSQGVWDCLIKAGIEPKDAENFVHGSTIAINIAIEETGAKIDVNDDGIVQVASSDGVAMKKAIDKIDMVVVVDPHPIQVAAMSDRGAHRTA